MGSIAIIGAGIAGLTAATELRSTGHDVVVFEKSRGPGGRMSTRRQQGYQFDHGAQYFTARTDAFKERLGAWMEAGVADRWTGKVVAIDGNTYRERSAQRYVGTPGMSSICGFLADDLEVHWETRVAPLTNGRDLLDADGVPLGEFDAVIVSAPADQTRELLQSLAPDIASEADAGRYAPCWAAMVSGVPDLGLAFDAAAVADNPVGWFAKNSSKPGRDKADTWVLHATPQWSREFLEADPDEALELMLDAWADVVGTVDPKFAVAHRWRYAQVVDPVGQDCLVDIDSRVVACGDWCIAPRVESASASGVAAAAAVADLL